MSWISKLTNKLTISLSPQEQMVDLWNNICQNTLHGGGHEILKQIHDDIQELVNIIALANLKNPEDEIIKTLSLHQIPRKLVELAVNDMPHGIVDIVLDFFNVFSKQPLSSFLHFPFIIDPLNSLIEKASPQKPDHHTRLIRSYLDYIVKNPKDINLFIPNPCSSPLIHQFAQLIVSDSAPMYEVFFQLISLSRTNSELLHILTEYSPILATSIDFIHDCVLNRNTEPSKLDFLKILDYTMTYSPPDLSESFFALFDEEVAKPLVFNQIQTNPTKCLKSAIYILTLFDNDQIVQEILDFLAPVVISFLDCDSNDIVFLTLRFITLVMEHRELEFNLEVPSSFSVSLDFMTYLPDEWFVQSNVNNERAENWRKVSINLARSQAMGRFATWTGEMIVQIIPKVLSLFSKFMDNEPRMNLVITDFFSTIATTWGNTPTYFALCEECKDGLCQTLRIICQKIREEYETKSTIINEISEAYKKETNQKTQNLVILLEFLKELLSIAQTKNLLTQREVCN